jgi:hypothetical protein
MINEIDKLHYCSGNYFRDGLCTHSIYDEYCETICKTCRFYRKKFETVPEFEERTGQKINPYQSVYSRRGPNDCWHSEMYYMTQSDTAYCREFGTPEIIVSCNDISPRLLSGRSVSASEGVWIGDPVESIRKKGWNSGYTHAAKDFEVIVKENNVDPETKKKMLDQLDLFLGVKVKGGDDGKVG